MKHTIGLVLFTLFLAHSHRVQAGACLTTQDKTELAAIRADAQVMGNYANGWLLEKPGPRSRSLRCIPIEGSDSQRCTKHGASSFLTLNKERELVSGLIIEEDGSTEFIVKPDGQLECAIASTSALDDHSTNDSDNKLVGGIILAFAPTTNSKGFCEPERVDIVDTAIDGKRLYSIRGDARYTMPTGTTEIPFQSVHKYPDQSGFSDTDAIIGLNDQGACNDLTINLKIKYCEYRGSGSLEKGPCPDIQVKGAAGFTAINLTRTDLGATQ